MAMNQRIIASDLKVNKEQLGDKGLYFERHNAQGLVEKILSVWIDKNQTIEYNYETKLRSFGNTFKSVINRI